MSVNYGTPPAPPQNAPGAAQPTVGVQAGISQQVITGQFVILYGDIAGMFVYSGTPALGNPPIVWATDATSDPYGNPVTPGLGATVGSVDGSVITAETITAEQIASATIEGSNIASATIQGSNIGSGTITASNIQDASITGTQIASASIQGSNIADATITGANIGSGTITASNIQDASITGTQIAAGTVTGSNLADNTVTAGQIADATITSTQIAAGSITGSNIGDATITGSNLADATVTEVQIADNTITTTVISDSAGITGTQLASGTVTGSNIAAQTITGSNISAQTITGSNIASETIEAGNIASGTITAAQIQSGTVVAGIIDGTQVTGAALSGGSITSPDITGGTLTGSSLVVTGPDGAALVYEAPGYTQDFETGTGSWTGTNVDIAQSSTVAYTGSFSLMATATTSAELEVASPSTAATCAAGDVVSLSAWVYAPSALSMRTLIGFWDGATLLTATAGSTVSVPAATWTQLTTIGATAPTSTTTCDARVEVPTTAATGTVFYTDDVVLAGALAVSVAGEAGTDSFGNSYPAGVGTFAGNATIQGTDYILNNSGAVFYNGAPADGNVTLAVAPQNFTDAYGNNIAPGLTYGANQSDGINIMGVTTESQTITVASPSSTTVTNLSCYVYDSILYRVQGKVICHQGSTAATQWLGLEGPSTSFVWITYQTYVTADSNTMASSAVYYSLQVALGAVLVPDWAAGDYFVWEFDGVIRPSANAYLNVYAALATSGDEFGVEPGSWIQVTALTA